MADRAVWQRTIVDERGNIIPGAEVTVRSYPGGSLVTLYENPEGAPKSNPFVTGHDGFARFWADSQRVEIVAIGAGSSIRWIVDLINADEVIGGAVSEATAAAAVAVSEAEAAADRAEAARDAATVNADVYSDIVSGLSDTSNGEQFQVVSGLEIVRYRNESGSAVEVARYPASEFVNIALDVASQPSLVNGEFYADDDEQPVYSITDEDGQALAAWNQQGEMDATPSLDMAEKSQRARSEFHTSDDQPAFALTDEDGRPLYAVDENGQPIVPFISEFYTTPSEVRYAWTDPDLRIFYALDETGKSVIGGGISGDSIPVRLAGTGAKEVYAQYNKLALTPSGDSFYGRVASSARDIVPTAQDMYDLLDDLVDEFPDYIERTLLGQDVAGNDIYQYRATPASYWTRWYDANAPEVLAKPKIILFGANHGNEKEAALTNYKLLREICLRWREDERLAFLRWGMDLVLIPVLNPSGFNENDFLNGNGVNINRNFPTGWENAPGPSYKGPSPASEPETQIALQVFDDHPDACAIIDHHNAGSLNDPDTPYAYWIGTDRPETIEIARMSCDHMMAYLRKEYPYVPQDNSRITRLVDSYNGTLTKHVQLGLGFNGFTLEGGSGFAEPLDRERHELEALTNLLTMCVRQENFRRVRETTFTYP